MVLAVGHSAQSVFAQVTNTKEKIFYQAIRPEAWRGESKCLFCDSSWFAKAAPINLCSNLWVSGMHSRLNCCLFYSAGVKAPACRWMLSGEWGSQDAQLCCWHNTIPERPATWFTQAKCHSNCEDLYQWERADEVTQLSDLTGLICAQMLPATLKALGLTNFTWNVPPQTVLTEPSFFTSVNQVWSGTFGLWNRVSDKLESLQNILSHHSIFSFVQMMWKKWLTGGLCK